MKRFLIFLVVAIAIVSLGLTIYYFSVDNEVIYIKSSYLVINRFDHIQTEGENGLLDFRNRADGTTLSFSLQQDESLEEKDRPLKLNAEEGYILAQNGGEAKIVINTSNRSYRRLVVDVLVCDGTEDYPYMIRNEEELKNIKPNESYRLGGNITLEGNWVPIASYSNVFDGNHFTISGMKITDNELTGGLNAGFISNLTGTIKNLNLADVDIDVSKAINVGAFAGECKGKIQTSEATGTITNRSSSTSTTGGIAGKTFSGSHIDRCGFDGTLNLTGSSITGGGIVGENSARITESYARGKVNNGNSGNTIFGGIIGTNTANSGNIYDCYFYAKENLTTPNNAAGLIYNQNSNVLITGCYYGGNIDRLNTGLVKNGSLVSDANGYLDSNDFRITSNFITTKGKDKDKFGNTYDRPWNFNGVWTMPTGTDYPILDVYSSVGSKYTDINTGDISTSSTINSPDKLYQAIKRDDANYAIKDDIDMSIDSTGKPFVWEPITVFEDDSADRYSHAIISKEGCTLKNLTIDASNLANDSLVGLVSRMGTGAIFSGIKFENVKIITDRNKTYKYVGVLAGESLGAVISNLTISDVDVNVSGTSKNGSAFGTLFGYADSSTQIKNVDVYRVDTRDGYFVYAGGIAGISYATITASGNVSAGGTTSSRTLYNYINDVSVVANFAGGVTGANAGAINYTNIVGFKFYNGNKNGSTQTSKIYGNGINIFVGGVVGINEHSQNTGKTKGTIADVFATLNSTTTSGTGYKMYLGGIAGYNSNDITRAYTKACNIVVEESHNAIAGGIAGYNSGRISYSVVDSNSRISTNVNASVATSVNNGNYILNTENCSVVGGLVGYDAQAKSNYSLYGCATLMKEIKGYYVGGISGISFGKAEKCYCGESTKDNGGVYIQGFLAGGLSAVVGNGYMKNCYVFAKLNTAGGTYNYQNVLSVVRMEVSAVAGLTVFALNSGTLLEGCYAVTTLSGSGVSYGSSAYLGDRPCGTLRNCAYQNAGTVATKNGTKLSNADFKGSNSYYNFRNAIGDISPWSFGTNTYPTLSGINVNSSSSKLPKYE